MRSPIRGDHGISMIETTIVLAVTAILIGLLAPVTSRTVDVARLTQAQTDIDAIATAIDAFVGEFTVGFTPFTTNGLTGGTTVQMLVSDGDIPPLSVDIEDLGSPHTTWDDPVVTGSTATIDFLERHLVTNNPSGTGAYATTADIGWRGAYISGPVDPDPWGNRYAVNVNYLRTSTANDTFVLSAGPDEQIDTRFEVNGVTPGDDDLTAVVRRDPGRTVP